MLKERCFACHGSLKQKGRSSARHGHAHQGARRPGASHRSETSGSEHPLATPSTSDMEERMPPEGKAVDLPSLNASRHGSLRVPRDLHSKKRKAIHPTIGPSTLLSRPPSPPVARIQSTPFSSPYIRSMRWSLRPFPLPAAHASALPGSGSTSPSQSRLQDEGNPQTNTMKRSSTDCWHPPTTVNDGGGTGWTSGVTVTGLDWVNSSDTAKNTSGTGAIGLWNHSMKTRAMIK